MRAVGGWAYGADVATSSTPHDTLPYADRSGFVEPLLRESGRFCEVIAGADPAAPVPSCPDWSADDLLWHLTEVQLFWAAICQGPVLDDAGVAAVEEGKPQRPAGRTALLDLSAQATERLVAALGAGAATDPTWSWLATDQTLGFSMRRQAHEALVHRVDAELVAGVEVSPVDAALAADGVDELLRVMWGLPDGGWATWLPSDQVVRVSTSDTGHAWTVRLGRWTGTGPQSGRTFDEVTALVLDHEEVEATATLHGTAVDLDLWLWNRAPHAVLERGGDPDAHAVLEEVLAQGVQ